MANQRYEFFDDYGRPNHKQVYLTGGENVRGAYIDTLELALAAPVTRDECDRVVSVLEKHLGRDHMVRVAWPEENRRVFVGLQRGYYNIPPLLAALAEAGLEVEHHGHFYSGRLGRAEAPVGSQSHRRT